MLIETARQDLFKMGHLPKAHRSQFASEESHRQQNLYRTDIALDLKKLVGRGFRLFDKLNAVHR